MPSAGYLIYSGVTPLIQTYFAMLAGYLLSRAGHWPKAASKSASKLCLSIALPCLLFSSIVPAIDARNIKAFGPLMALAAFYTVIGGCMAFIVREFLYVPQDFMQGILVLGALSNWANLPVSISSAVMLHAPFDPEIAPALSISYISAFIIFMNVIFFAFGLSKTLAWDYRPDVPHGSEAEVRLRWTEKPTYKFMRKIAETGKRPHHKHQSSDFSFGTAVELEVQSVTPLPLDSPILGIEDTQKQPRRPQQAIIDETPLFKRLIGATRSFLAVFLTPVTVTLIVSLVIVLVKPLRALFAPTEGYSFKGPTGDPPLAVLVSSAKFIGAMSVPLSLIQLGASFTEVTSGEKKWRNLPFASIAAMSACKLVFMPIIGILLVQALTRIGFIDASDKPLRFVCMLVSGTPSAVNILVVSQLYAGEHSISTLSVYLLAQYALMSVCSSILIAVILKIL